MRPIVKPIALLLGLALGLGLGLAAQAQNPDPAKLEDLKQRIEQLKDELSQAKGQRDDLQQELEASETEIGELQEKVDRIQEQLNDQNAQLQDLRQRRDQLHVQRRDQQDQFDRALRAAYQLGAQDRLKLLLNQENPATVSRVLHYYDYLLADRAARIDQYLATIAEINEVEPAIARKAEALARNRRALAEQQQALRSRQAERQRTLAKLNASIASADDELRRAEADRQRLAKLLAKLQGLEFDRPADQQPFARQRGQLPTPVAGTVLHRYGSPRVGRNLRWDGMVIAADPGTPVKAVHYGRVMFAEYLRGQGLLLILEHGDGYMTLYAHNQTLLVDTGDWVRAGQTVATVGNTGGRERAALYFEIRHNGQPANPDHWLRNRA